MMHLLESQLGEWTVSEGGSEQMFEAYCEGDITVLNLYQTRSGRNLVCTRYRVDCLGKEGTNVEGFPVGHDRFTNTFYIYTKDKWILSAFDDTTFQRKSCPISQQPIRNLKVTEEGYGVGVTRNWQSLLHINVQSGTANTIYKGKRIVESAPIDTEHTLITESYKSWMLLNSQYKAIEKQINIEPVNGLTVHLKPLTDRLFAYFKYTETGPDLILYDLRTNRSVGIVHTPYSHIFHLVLETPKPNTGNHLIVSGTTRQTKRQQQHLFLVEIRMFDVLQQSKQKSDLIDNTYVLDSGNVLVASRNQSDFLSMVEGPIQTSIKELGWIETQWEAYIGEN